MRGKDNESSINEVGSKSGRETVQINPYLKTNVNQEQAEEEEGKRGKDLEVVPPPYPTVVQPSSSPQIGPANTSPNPPINNQSVHPARVYDRHSINMPCSICGITVRTRVETNSTIITIAVVVLLFFCCFCLALIPLCISRCKRTIHYCPNCNCVLAKVREFE